MVPSAIAGRTIDHAVSVTVWRHGRVTPDHRVTAEETPVALSYNGVTQAVMMATPSDLSDFAVGFTMTEGIAALGEIETLAVSEVDDGIDLQMSLAGAAADRLSRRRRGMAGPVGCGLCGIDSLEQVLRPLPSVPEGRRISAQDIDRAVAALGPHQVINHRTSAVHGAAYVPLAGGDIMLREDVGRHNALDKLAGALVRSGQAAADGLVVVTSRLSVEMVQKAAMMGAPILIAVSAPTTLAVRTADEIGLTLVCVARTDGFEVVTHGWRIEFPSSTEENGDPGDVA